MVSIVIPVYNTEKFISETINSVLEQSYTNWELIIVDDGSTDDSKKIIKDFCLIDKRIKYFYQSNAGVSVARNNGIKNTLGNYIALLDADDVWEKDNLKIKIDLLKANKDLSWVYSNMYNADKDIKIIGEAEKGTDKNILESILFWDGEVVPGPCSNVIFARECIEEGVSFDKNLSTAADQDFTLQLAFKYKGFHIDKPLWRYRILEESMSRNIAVMERDHIAVFKKASQNKMFKNFWFEQRCFSNLYWILAGSWWKNGNNKARGFYFVIKALMANPFSIVKLVSKIK